MLSIFSGLIGLSIVGWTYLKNKPAFILGFFILASLSYRIVDVVYMDLVGTVFAIELNRYVRADMAAPVFVLSVMCFLIPLVTMITPNKFRRAAMTEVADRPYYFHVTNLAFLGCAFFIALLYIDMLRLGTIPILSGMDRLEYDAIAGIFHNPAYELSFLPNITFGLFTVLPRLQRKRYDYRFALLFAALLAYWVITGNRFSVFYRDISFYIMPFAAVLAKQHFGVLRRRHAADAWSVFLSSRLWVSIGIMVVTALLVGLVYNSFFNVRGYNDPFFQIEQRVFVQPIQFWVGTWEQMGGAGTAMPSGQIFRDLFVAPIDPAKNTSIQVLMANELGYHRAAELLSYGQQYAGGYPEIMFLWLGYWFAPVMLLILGIFTVLLLRFFLRTVCRGFVITPIFIVYLYFAFTLAYIGGMLNFVLAWTFPVKIILPILVYNWEKSIISKPVPVRSP